MNLISKILGGATGGIIKDVADVVDQFNLSGEEKQKFQLEMETLLQKRDSEIEQTLRTELEAKMSIIVAEMQQGDNYTKRARPTLVYFGMLVIAFNYCVIPSIQSLQSVPVDPFILPDEFWLAWGGVVGIWSMGRDAVRTGFRSPAVKAITGAKSVTLGL